MSLFYLMLDVNPTLRKTTIMINRIILLIAAFQEVIEYRVLEKLLHIRNVTFFGSKYKILNKK